jgi:hypothetical protein
VTAQPIHEDDPHDPERILARLPERERTQFLHEYQTAAEAAVHEVWRYKELRALLHRWSLVVVAANQPGYYETLDEVKAGEGERYDFGEAITAELIRRS